MHPQLEILLELQDLKGQQRELAEAAEDSIHEIERKVFRVKPEDAAAQLQAKIEEMESALAPEIANRYRVICNRRNRAVAPVLSGICYGCFMAVPTGVPPSNDEIRWCEHCGSFLYFVD